MGDVSKRYSDILKEYKERLERGTNTYAKKYDEMRYSGQARKNIMPEDIKQACTDTQSDNASNYLMPALNWVHDKVKQEISVNQPQFKLKGNNPIGVEEEREFNYKLREFLSYNNFGYKSQFGYDYGINKGTIVEVTVFKELQEFFYGEPEPVSLGGSIDFLYFDPMMVMPDPDASPQDIANTCEWCIITLGFYSYENIKKRYPEYDNAVMSPGSKYGVNFSGSINDEYLRKQQELAGNESMSEGHSIAVRKYFLRESGKVYTIVNDAVIVEEAMNHMLITNRMPVNICALDPDPDCIFGYTTWEKIKYSVAMASRALNMLLDNASFNNSFPIVLLANTNPKVIPAGNDTQFRFLELDDPLGIGDIRALMQKIQFPEVTNGMQLMLNFANEMISLLTGVTPASMGVQAKQMRTAGEAGIYQNAILQNSSKIVLNIENSHINPVIWDMMRIFKSHYDKFGFTRVSKDFLANYKNVHVVNGSTLAIDKASQTDWMTYAFTRAMQAPSLWQQYRLEEEGIESFGKDPRSYLKSPEEIQQEQKAAQQIAIQNMQEEINRG